MNKMATGSVVRRQRVNRSVEQWRALLQAQQASGLSQESYCLAEGVSSTSFAKWRKRFREERASSSSTKTAIVKAAVPEFVELARGPRPLPVGAHNEVPAGVKLRLELGSGIVLELTRL